MTRASEQQARPWVADGKLEPGVIVVGLGGNIGGEQRTVSRLQSAISELSTRFGQARVSSLYCSSPIGPVQSQPDFVNAVALWKVDRDLKPDAILTVLQEVENSHGRVREIAGGARTLDLDFLYCGPHVCESEELELPHPRVLDRAFVIVPLIELLGEDFVPLGSLRSLGKIRKTPNLQSQGLRPCFLSLESGATGLSDA